MAAVKPAWMALQQGCRQAGVEVMYTVIQSLTADGRDRSTDYKISGPFTSISRDMRHGHSLPLGICIENTTSRCYNKEWLCPKARLLQAFMCPLDHGMLRC